MCIIIIQVQQPSDNSHAGEGLGKLGYAKGNIKEEEHTIRYHQPTYNGRFSKFW